MTESWLHAEMFIITHPRSVLDYLFERALDSGYESVLPEAIGALTSSPILGEDVTYGEEGEQVVGGRVWWFPNYQVIDEVKTLIDTGEVTFALGEALEPEDQNPAP